SRMMPQWYAKGSSDSRMYMECSHLSLLPECQADDSVIARYEKKEQEGSMMPHFVQKAQPMENRWLLYSLTFLIFVATVAPTSLAMATICRYIENDGTIPGMATGKGSWWERDMFGGLVLSPVRGVTPYMKNSRIALSETEIQGIVTIRACLDQDILKSELFTQAMIKPIGKTPLNVHKPPKKVSALPYNGNRQVHAI